MAVEDHISSGSLSSPPQPPTSSFEHEDCMIYFVDDANGVIPIVVPFECVAIRQVVPKVGDLVDFFGRLQQDSSAQRCIVCHG